MDLTNYCCQYVAAGDPEPRGKGACASHGGVTEADDDAVAVRLASGLLSHVDAMTLTPCFHPGAGGSAARNMRGREGEEKREWAAGRAAKQFTVHPEGVGRRRVSPPASNRKSRDGQRKHAISMLRLAPEYLASLRDEKWAHQEL